MKKVIIVIIVLLIIGAGFYFFLGDDSDKVHTIIKKKTEYKELKAGEEVNINQNKFYVMYDSSKNDDDVTLISELVLYNEEIPYVLDGIYETSSLRDYLENDYVSELNVELVEKNGYKVRLFNEDDFKDLVSYEYDSKSDTYIINECPDYICFINTYFSTMIDTDDSIHPSGTVESMNEVENPLYDEYNLHLKYYNYSADWDTFKLVSVTSDGTLRFRAILNVKKSSLE